MAKINLFALVAFPAIMSFSACLSPPVETPVNTVTQTTPIRVSQNTNNAVDILFMVDNSSSMTAMQAQLQAHFADFLKVFEDLATAGTYADVHIGVVTSDYGAGDVANPGVGGCDAAPGGQKGIMQVLPATYLGLKNCAAPTGSPYIEYSFQPGGANNLPVGQTGVAGLNETFTCMASVGAQGCGFEHQLESVYQALTQTNALAPGGAGPNGNFLRPEAILAIVFVTNEDDASADPKTHIYEPVGVNNAYGYYDTYRQTRWGVGCKQGGKYTNTPYPMMLPTDGSGNPVPIDLSGDGCEGAPNLVSTDFGLEYDLSRYINFFTGTVKSNPLNVVLVGIDGPTTKYQIILANQGTGLGLMDGTHPSKTFQLCETLNPPACAVRLNHSCQNNADPAFFADPPIRLSTVIHNGKTLADEEPICGADFNSEPDYTASLKKVGNLISSALAPGCIPARLTSVTNPDCSVQDVTQLTSTTTSQVTIPECNMGVTTPTPTYNGQLPCWVVQAKVGCSPTKMDGTPNPLGSPDGVGLTVIRKGSAPPQTHAAVSCSTIASSGDGGL